MSLSDSANRRANTFGNLEANEALLQKGRPHLDQAGNPLTEPGAIRRRRPADDTVYQAEPGSADEAALGRLAAR